MKKRATGHLKQAPYLAHLGGDGEIVSLAQGSKFAMRIRTIAKNCEAKRIRFAFAIGTDCEFAEQNLRKIHCFQNIFPGFYGLNFNGVLFSN